MEDFLASKSGNSLGTVNTYRAYLNGYLKWKKGRNIDMQSYDRYILHLKSRKHRQNGVATAAVVLREYAGSRGVNTNGWQVPRTQRITTEYLRPNEIKMLRDAIFRTGSIERNLFMFDFLLNTGLRISELLALRWCDIDLGDVASGGQTCNIRQAKGNKSRTIRLSRGAANAAMRYARCLFGDGATPEALRLKADRIVDVKTKEAVEVTFRRIGTIAGLDVRGLHPHLLRHTFGVMVTKRKLMGEKELQTHMGHASIATTERYQQFADLEGSGALAAADLNE